MKHESRRKAARQRLRAAFEVIDLETWRSIRALASGSKHLTRTISHAFEHELGRIEAYAAGAVSLREQLRTGHATSDDRPSGTYARVDAGTPTRGSQEAA